MLPCEGESCGAETSRKEEIKSMNESWEERTVGFINKGLAGPLMDGVIDLQLVDLWGMIFDFNKKILHEKIF